MINIYFLTGLTFLTFSQAAHARSSDACFTKEEVRTMVAKRDELSKASSDCLKAYWATHTAYYDSHKYSKYFGNRNKSINTPDKRAKSILRAVWPDLLSDAEYKQFDQVFFATAAVDEDGDHARPGLSDLEKFMARSNPRAFSTYMSRKDSLNLLKRAQEERGSERGQVDLRPNSNETQQNISCVDMARRCLQAGFKAIGMADTFKKIDNEVLTHGVSGTEMQKSLSDLGWRTLYFNPDTSQNAAWDAEEKQILPPTEKKKWQGAWGDHAYSWSGSCIGDRLNPNKSTGGVKCSDEYQLGSERPIPIDDKRLLVDFRTSPPAAFKKVPFFIGTAHGGYHVFPGYFGNIIEGHSMRALTSRDNLEVSEFNPLNQDNHGGPRWTNVEHYRSGVIVVPPGYLNDPATLQNPPVDENGCVDLKPRRR